jgi:hypothetical protein
VAGSPARAGPVPSLSDKQERFFVPRVYRAGIWSGPVDRSSSELLEESVDIAWFYLHATGGLGDGNAVGFLNDAIERMIRQGQRNRMFLANMALIKYRQSRSNVISIHA